MHGQRLPSHGRHSLKPDGNMTGGAAALRSAVPNALHTKLRHPIRCVRVNKKVPVRPSAYPFRHCASAAFER